MDDLDRREALGRKKYGTDVDRPDLTHKEWLQHAYEETLDKALYLKRAIDLCEVETNADVKPTEWSETLRKTVIELRNLSIII